MKRLDPKHSTSRRLVPVPGSDRISDDVLDPGPNDAEARYEQFFLLCKDLLCFAGTDGYFQQVNPAFTETLGFSEQELLSRPFLDFVHPDDRESTISEIANLDAGRDTVAFTNRYRCKDGRLLWLEWSARPTASGAVFAVARDVTANREAVTALRESEQRFRELAEHIREVFYVFDAHGQELLYVSPAFESVWGFPTDDFYSDPSTRFRSIGCSQERARVENAWKLSCLRERDFDLEYSIVRPDGGVRWVRDRCYPIVIDSVLTKIVGIAANITARREAEEAARARSTELAHVARLSTMGELASGIAHELNQPLSAISIHAETCRMQLANQKAETALEDVDAITAQTERAARVLRRLRAFVRKHEPTTKVVD
ncbi:MAG: PAS domain S-box protein, partial [Planctomycetota bacterium]